MFTFLSIDECEALAGGNPNDAKERLAREVTALIHGKAEADRALEGARAAFGGGGDTSAMPTVHLERSRFEAGYNIVDLFADAGLAASKSEARRLVEQGGAFVSGGGGESAGGPAALAAVTGPRAVITASQLSPSGELILRAWKKRYCRCSCSCADNACAGS